MKVHEKVGKSRNTLFFQWFVAPEGRKVGLLKRRVRSHPGRREMKNCMPLWREDARSRFGSKTVKTSEGRSTLGSWDVEKCTPLWREAPLEVKTRKIHHSRSTFGSSVFEKVYGVVARRYAKHVAKPKCKKHSIVGAWWSTFGSLDVERCWTSARGYGAKHISKAPW